MNRKRYESNVKKAFENFISDLISTIQKHDKKIEITYKEAVFRINRDVRFSKDKTPYKMNRSAAIAAGGKKDHVNPGIYFEITPEHVRVYTGVFGPDKHQLLAIREEIADNLEEFDKIINEKKFKNPKIIPAFIQNVDVQVFQLEP